MGNSPAARFLGGKPHIGREGPCGPLSYDGLDGSRSVCRAHRRATRALLMGRKLIVVCAMACSSAAAEWILSSCGGGTDQTASAHDAGVEHDGGVSLCGIVADSGGGSCWADVQVQHGLTCCNGVAVLLTNDPLNCGACGHRCNPGEMCLESSAAPPACVPAECTTQCGPCQTCCLVPGPGAGNPPPYCVDGPTCPIGCLMCP
jgi:Stigma-specific protein, Stig1